MRKKLATKICAIVMTAAMVASMAGCGDDSGDNSQASTPGNSQASNSGQESGGADNQTPDDTQPDEQIEEEVYDCGGAVIRVEGGRFSDLNEENKLDENGQEKEGYVKKRDFANQIEEKYNCKIEYVTLNTDGYDSISAVLTPMVNDVAHADIFCARESVMIGVKDYLAVLSPEDLDKLKMGGIYTEAASWGGKTYGWTYDNMGSAYVLCYSREYLKNIGMDETPTDWFVRGDWDYEKCREYLNLLKTKLPDGTYPIAVHSNHWVSMAPAANGVVSIDSDGGIHLADEAYVQALEFYTSLIDDQLAPAATGVEILDDGGIKASQLTGMGDMSGKGDGNKYVITMVEAWQYGSMLKDKGEWGIVPFPWGPEVTCSGDYTTLSDNYLVPQSIWTNVMVPDSKYRPEATKNIPDYVLHQIARDFCALDDPEGAAVREAVWEAESKGETYENYGYKPGDPGYFSTMQDIEVFDWMHTRAALDWGLAFNDNTIVRVNRNGYYVIAARKDARSTGEGFVSEGEQNMKDKKLK